MRIKPTDPRQVKLVLISWSVAVAALIGLLTALWFLAPRPAREVLQQAENAVLAEDYSHAVDFYDEFLKHYAAAPNADDVRSLRCLAELRLAERKATASGDWTPAFEVATEQVSALPKEHADSHVMQEFGIALAKIGDGLAQQVKDDPDGASVDRLQSVVNMLETDIPEADRPAQMLDDMKGILQSGKRKKEGRRELDRTLNEIRVKVAGNDVQAAYKSYREFVKAYPELADDVRLTDAMKQVSAAGQKAVTSVQRLLTAVRQERPSGVLAAMPLTVQPVKGELPAGRGKLVFVVEQGTAYGLDAFTGKTVWRRFVALDPRFSLAATQPITARSTTWAPARSDARRGEYGKFFAVTALPVPGPVASDVVLCDPVRQEVLRVDGATGALLWRLVVGVPIVAEPVRADKWLLLLTSEQRLLLIDLATGDSPRYFQLPQAVRLPPVVDAAHGLIFLAADQSNLIVLDIGRCRQLLHVGHEVGTIAAPPAVVGDFLLLPVNDAPGKATIRVFAISKDTEGRPLKHVQTLAVEGSIDTTPVAVGNGVAIVTEQGELSAFERNEAGNKFPFQNVPSRGVSVKEKATHYAISDGGRFWVADRQLTCFAVQADERRIVPRAVPDLRTMRFVQSPVIDGGTMFQVLQRPGMPGVTVSAFDLKQNEAVWQTWVAAPLAAEPTLGSVSGKLTAATASGGMFRAAMDELKPQAKPWEPVLTIDSNRLDKPLCSLLPLPGEMFAMTSGADTRQIVIYDPKEQDKQFRWTVSPCEMSVAPAAFAGGLLTACVDGQVCLLDPEARGDMAKPLQPALKGIMAWEWRAPGGRRRQAGRVVRRRQAIDGDPHQQRRRDGPHRSRDGQGE